MRRPRRNSGDTAIHARSDTHSNLVLATVAGEEEVKLPNRSIGAILVDAGRLSPADAESVLKLQRRRGLRFGEAALELDVVTPADIEFALARQFEYPYLLKGQSQVSEALDAAYNPFSPQVEAFRALRTQLLLRLVDADKKTSRLAIVSPEPGEGRSYLAASLAIVFSQLGEKTLLIDADMRHPSQHALFGLENRIGLSAMLSARGGAGAIQRIPSLMDLSLLPSGATPPNPHELLARPLFAHLLDELSNEYDVVILDTPPGGQYAEALILASRSGAALMVARRNSTRVAAVRDLAQSMAHARVSVLGTVLNEF